MAEPISEIIDDEDSVRPVLVHFQNSELLEGEEDKLRTGIYRKNDRTKLLAVATKDILYSGTINKDDANKDLYNRCLLISNRKTGQVSLLPVDTAILSPQFDMKETDQRSVPDTIGTVNQLNKEFGSKKIKRITEQRERLKMNIDDVKEQLEQTVAGVDVSHNESFVVDSTENDSMYKPPINREASVREEVYVLNDMIPEVVLDSLEEEATSVLSSDVDELDLSPFIKERIRELQDSSSTDVTQKCKLFLYIDYLIKFILKPVKSITKRFILCSSSAEVNNHILDNFSVTSNTGRTRPLSMRDKTICYILVLAMIACDYHLDVESLSKNIKLGVKKLQEIGRILAFTSQGKNKNIMILKIPLPPAVSVSPRKRKR